MMTVIIFLIGIISYSFSINIRFKLKQEEAIVVAFLETILFTYVLGLLNILGVCIYAYILLFIISIAYNIYSIKTKNIKIKSLITLPSILYYLLIILVYFKFRDDKFIFYDEFMFWGTNVKFMLEKNVLWGSKAIEAVHQVYPPITGVEQYVFCKLNNGFSEGICYLAMITLLVTPIMLLFRNENYSIKSAIKVIATYTLYYISTQLFKFDIASLSVDCLLGVFFGVMVYYAYTMNVKSKKDIAILSILLISITLIKTNGMLFAGIVIGELFIANIGDIIKQKNKKLIKKFILLTIALVALVLITYGIWTIYYKLNGKSIDDRHDKNYSDGLKISQFIETLKENEEKTEIKEITIFKKFKKALKVRTILNTEKYNNTYWSVLFVNIIAIILLIMNKHKVKNTCLLVYMNIGMIAFFLSNLYIFLYVFIEFQGVNLMGYERYTATYLLAFLLSIVSIALESNKKRNWIVMFSVICAICFFNNWENNARVYEVNTVLQQNADFINEKTSKDSRIYIIDEKEDFGIDAQELRYRVAPRETNLLYEWNISATREYIYYQKKITPQELLDELKEKNYDYVYIINTTNMFLREYKELFNEDDLMKLRSTVGPGILFRNTETARGMLFMVKDGILESVN